MKNVVIYGAGTIGYRSAKFLKNEYNIICFIDDKKELQGLDLFGYPVSNPKGIGSINFDYIVIAGDTEYDNMKNRLVNELNVPLDKIKDCFGRNIVDLRVAILRMLASEVYARNLSGNVAELGVYRGDFAVHINKTFNDRTLYLLDSFEGFSEKDIEVEKREKYSYATTGEFGDTNINYVESKLEYQDNCNFIKGYFPQSIKSHPIQHEEFCFVSIDVDLYQPIYSGLEFFYPRMVDNGYILIHDYDSSRYLGVKQAVMEFWRKHNCRCIPMPDALGSLVVVK